MIKLSLITAVKLYEAVLKLSDTELDFASAHALLLTRNELAPHIGFFAESEKGIVLKYAEKDENGNPIVDFSNQYTIPSEYVDRFTSERKELFEIEVEISKRKLKTVPDKISPNALELLEIAFELPGEVNENG